jgi:hypothetical protein
MYSIFQLQRQKIHFVFGTRLKNSRFDIVVLFQFIKFKKYICNPQSKSGEEGVVQQFLTLMAIEVHAKSRGQLEVYWSNFC